MVLRYLILIAAISTLSSNFIADYLKLNPVKITSKICLQKIGTAYNITKFPNIYNHFTHDDAVKELNQYMPLINTKCSEYLALFLCSIYIPLYSPILKKTIRPCKSICLASQIGCRNLIKKYGIALKFDCYRYHEENGHEVCIGKSILNTPKKTVQAVQKVNYKRKIKFYKLATNKEETVSGKNTTFYR